MFSLFLIVLLTDRAINVEIFVYAFENLHSFRVFRDAWLRSRAYKKGLFANREYVLGSIPGADN